MVRFPQVAEGKCAFYVRWSVLRKDDAVQVDRVG
jgi:hypothetical protein